MNYSSGFTERVVVVVNKVVMIMVIHPRNNNKPGHLIAAHTLCFCVAKTERTTTTTYYGETISVVLS